MVFIQADTPVLCKTKEGQITYKEAHEICSQPSCSVWSTSHAKWHAIRKIHTKTFTGSRLRTDSSLVDIGDINTAVLQLQHGPLVDPFRAQGNITIPEAWLQGLWFSHGNPYFLGGDWFLCHSEPDILWKAISILTLCISDHFIIRLDKIYVTTTSTKQLVREWIRKQLTCGQKKKISDDVFSASSEIQLAFVEGCFQEETSIAICGKLGKFIPFPFPL